MALLASTTLLASSTNPSFQNPNNPSSSSPFFSWKPLYFHLRRRRSSLRSSSAIAVFAFSNGYYNNPTLPPFPPLPKTLTDKSPPRDETHSKIHPILINLAASAVLFIGLGARACSISSGKLPVTTAATSQTVTVDDDDNGRFFENNSVNMENHGTAKPATVEDIEDKELQAVFEKWKSKSFSLTVPLRMVALRGSVPPSWIKDFMQSQGKGLSLRSEFRGSLNDIICDLTSSFSKGNVEPKSVMAADIVTVGDSWLSSVISKGLFEPIQAAEEQDWFKGLSEKWKVYLRRNSKGEIDSDGEIWAAPYRWGSMVIAYKKNKFQKHKLAPIEDWEDLWRPELAGKISMVDSPREVVGAVLKHMGASYNSKDIDSQVIGGKDAVRKNLALLQKQVRLFDSVHYLKAFGVGDVWVAVGWSSDILPAAKRMSNVAVIVPKSGASLWADLWAIPAAERFATNRIGGRIRGPSPLIHQWIEFCLQAARALPFEQEVIPGASPFALENPLPQNPHDLTKGKPKLETNLIAGVPPPDILSKCEFLEPLSSTTLMDYQWLIENMQRPGRGWIDNMKYYITSAVQTFRLTPQSR